MFNRGISRSGDVVDLGVEAQIVEKSGTWFSYGEIRLGQGRENTKKFLESKPELLEEIEQAIAKKTEEAK